MRRHFAVYIRCVYIVYIVYARARRVSLTKLSGFVLLRRRSTYIRIIHSMLYIFVSFSFLSLSFFSLSMYLGCWRVYVVLVVSSTMHGIALSLLTVLHYNV